MSRKRPNKKRSSARNRQFASGKKKAVKPNPGLLFSNAAVDQLAEALMRLPDPDEILKKAGMSRKDLRRLENDDEIAAALETRLFGCITTPWRLEYPDGGNEVALDFARTQFERFEERIMTAAWNAVPYGYSVQEVIYAREGERIVWDRIEERPFEWFSPKPDGRLVYFKAGSREIKYGEEVDTVFKFFLTRRRPTYRNPYGEALLSRIYWPWFYRYNGWKFWAVFLERFGAPMLVGKTNGNTSDMAAALASAVQSAVMAVGADDDVTAISPSNAGDAFQRFSEQVDRRIQKVILGQTLTTDVGKSGSYAAAKVHDRVRDDRRRADVRIVQDTVQRMINALTALNFPGTEPPRFIMEDEAGLQAERAARDETLHRAGIKFKEQYILRAYDFEEGDFEIMDARPGGAGQGFHVQHPQPGLKLAAGGVMGRFTPQQEALEALADDALDGLGSPIPVSRIKAEIKAAADPEDLERRLAGLVSDIDPARFQDILERALFAADVMGYAHMEEGPA